MIPEPFNLGVNAIWGLKRYLIFYESLIEILGSFRVTDDRRSDASVIFVIREVIIAPDTLPVASFNSIGVAKGQLRDVSASDSVVKA